MNEGFFFKIKNESTSVKIFLSLNVLLYVIVSLVSTIHSITLFELFNLPIIAVILAFGFELGQAVSLFSITVLDKLNKTATYIRFVALTLVQVIGNLYHGYNFYIEHMKILPYNNLINYFEPLSNLVGIDNNDLIKIFVALLNGSLPIIALLFIKSTINYINPDTKEELKPIINTDNKINEEGEVKIDKPFKKKIKTIKENIKIENKNLVKDDFVVDNIIEKNQNIEENKNNVEVINDVIDEIKEDFIKNDINEIKENFIENNENDINEIEEEIKENNDIQNNDKTEIENKIETVIETKSENIIINQPIKEQISLPIQNVNYIKPKRTKKMKVIDGKDAVSYRDIDIDKLKNF